MQSDIIDQYDVSIFEDRFPVRLRELACLVKEIQKLQCIACSSEGIGVHYSIAIQDLCPDVNFFGDTDLPFDFLTKKICIRSNEEDRLFSRKFAPLCF